MPEGDEPIAEEVFQFRSADGAWRHFATPERLQDGSVADSTSHAQPGKQVLHVLWIAQVVGVDFERIVAALACL
jgi:hypothetical protein